MSQRSQSQVNDSGVGEVRLNRLVLLERQLSTRDDNGVTHQQGKMFIAAVAEWIDTPQG